MNLDDAPTPIKRMLLEALKKELNSVEKKELTPVMKQARLEELLEMAALYKSKTIPEEGEIVFSDEKLSGLNMSPDQPAIVIRVLEEPIIDLSSHASGTIAFGRQYNVEIMFWNEDAERYVTDIVPHQHLKRRSDHD